uniref:Uncharacterized protein n=1 Tax=Parascaris univalens TaxID=6257 RepID=A0A915ABP7_PARUN
MCAYNEMTNDKPRKPFLRKGEGVTGRLMNKVHYPQLRAPSRSQNSYAADDVRVISPPLSPDLDVGSGTNNGRHQSRGDDFDINERPTGGCKRSDSSSSQITSQEQRPSSSRPLTGTTDSGCPEDPLVLLSPVLTEDTRLWASADQDVTTDGGHGSPTAGIRVSALSSQENDRSHSVEYDVSDYPESAQRNRKSPVDLQINGDDHSRVFSTGDRSPSVIVDVTKSEEKEDEASSTQAVQILKVANDTHLSVGNSTAEFERIEAQVNGIDLPEREQRTVSSISHSTDGTRSKHWRRVIRDFGKEAAKNNEFPSQTITPSSGISSTTPSDGERSTPKAMEYKETGPLEETRLRIQQMNAERRHRSSASSASSMALRPMRSVFPSIFQKHSARRGRTLPPSRATSDSTSGGSRNTESASCGEEAPTRVRFDSERGARRSRLLHSHSTPLLEECSGEESPGGRLMREVLDRTKHMGKPIIVPNQVPKIEVPPLPSVDSIAGAEIRNLAKQLRDLIAHLDIVSEEHRCRIAEIEEVWDAVIDENRDLHRIVDDLKATIKRLEERDKMRAENLAMLQEREALRSADFEKLKRENNLLTRKQRSKQDDESTIVKICREQMDELKASKRDLERQKIDLRSQMRKLEATIKEKDKRIEEITAEKERIEKRFKMLSVEQAKRRGRFAEETMAQEAVERASNKPPVSMGMKRIGGMTVNVRQPRNAGNKRTGKENVIPDDAQALLTLNEGSTDTTTDSGEGTMPMEWSPGSSSPLRGQNNAKSVHWNEPLTTAFFSPPSFRNNRASIPEPQNGPNMDMLLTRMEENIVGRASLYESSEGDFTVYTRTHCGCNYYEYSNTDTRWLHPSNKYQVNYYGQAGATTVQIDNGLLLVRHFLNGQLEIYRHSGEVTLVTPHGRRIEVIKDRNGLLRAEIYDTDGRVRVIGSDGCEIVKNTTSTSCYRLDGSYVSHLSSDDSYEWRAVEYVVRRFKSGDVKVRLVLIETSITMLCCDVGTVKHLKKPTHCTQKYCVEWGKIARQRSRQAAGAV